jgi:hypothetical protein
MACRRRREPARRICKDEIVRSRGRHRLLIGLLVERLGFDTLERVTVRRWGAQR